VTPELLSAPKTSPEVGRSYRRDEVPALFGLKYQRRGTWDTGVSLHDDKLILFVTLEKGAQQAKYQYKDHFLSAEMFQWQSQNRTPQKGKLGQVIRHHNSQGIGVHLFVRKAAKSDGQTSPFVYSGTLQFVEWEGEKPITVRWRLKSPLSPALQQHFQ